MSSATRHALSEALSARHSYEVLDEIDLELIHESAQGLAAAVLFRVYDEEGDLDFFETATKAARFTTQDI